MRSLLADIFRLVFKIKFFKNRFFGIHQRIIQPLNLFKGVSKKVNWNNRNLTLNIDDWIHENIYFLGEYETAELKAIEKYIHENSVFIDLGANLGLHTLYFSNIIHENGCIISFEPFS